MNLFDKCKKILGDREKEYGKAYDSFEYVSDLWRTYLAKENNFITLTPKDVALMMVLFKIAREQANPKPDNIIDAINYLYLAYYLTYPKEINDKEDNFCTLKNPIKGIVLNWNLKPKKLKKNGKKQRDSRNC